MNAHSASTKSIVRYLPTRPHHARAQCTPCHEYATTGSSSFKLPYWNYSLRFNIKFNFYTRMRVKMNIPNGQNEIAERKVKLRICKCHKWIGIFFAPNRVVKINEDSGSLAWSYPWHSIMSMRFLYAMVKEEELQFTVTKKTASSRLRRSDDFSFSC